MKTLQRYMLAATALLAAACSGHTDFDDTTPSGAGGNAAQDGPVIAISAGDYPTRTAIDTSDWATTRWAKNDRVTIWATSNGGESYALAGETFSLAYYRDEWSKAVFSRKSDADPLPEGTYTYYGVSPAPAEPERINGTTVTYTLDATQSGRYEGKYDILTATPLTGAALPQYSSHEAMLQTLPAQELAFHHKCHALRIELPEGRTLWGEPIKRVVIEFPREVVGNVSVDATDPTAALTLDPAGASKTVTIDLSTAESEGYVWAFINPTALNEENVSFTLYTANGLVGKAYPATGAGIAGHITPVRLTLPATPPVSAIEFTVASNNLGEDPTKVVVKAPAGMLFCNGTDTTTLEADGMSGEGTGRILGKVEFYAHLYGQKVTAGQFQLTYESNSAENIPGEAQVSGFSRGGTTGVGVHIPYLFEENFDNKSNFELWIESGPTLNPTGESLGSGFSGWSGVRVQVSDATTGKAMRVSYRSEWARYPGHLRTAPMARIRGGFSPKVQVLFHGARESSKISAALIGTTTTAAGSSESWAGWEPSSSQPLSSLPVVSGLNFKNIPADDRSFTLNATNTTRICWKVTGDNSGSGWAYYSIYLDNIRVKLTK